MNRLLAIAVLALVFTGTSVHAEGYYVSGNLGASILSDSDVEQTGFPTIVTSFDPGFTIGAAMGHDYGNIRAEGELAFRTNSIDDLSFLGFILPAEGNVSSLSIMVNGYYDFRSANSALIPYLGAGLGFANVTVDASTFGIQLLDDNALVFAYQLMAGFAYDINPTTALTFGYRYFATSNPEFDDPVLPGVLPDIEAEIQNHEFIFGFRVAF